MTDQASIEKLRKLETDQVPGERTEPAFFDRDDVEMLFRCLMQFARHLAKKHGFTIKQWPEN